MVGNEKLPAGNGIIAAVHDRPKGLGFLLPLTREDAKSLRWIVGRPAGTGKQGREGAVDRSCASQSFRIPRGQLIPDSPDIFPAFKADAIEKGFLQIVVMVVRPAVGKVDHVTSL